MRILLKSKLYQQEIMRWALILGLIIWALVASVLALQNRKETLLIGIDERGSVKLITDKDDQFLQEEIKGFLNQFLELYYSYDENTFESRVARAADLFSDELWSEKQAELLALSEKLKKEPLAQSFELEVLDLIGTDKVEAVLNIKIKQRISEHKIKLKVNLVFDKRKRSIKNPWGFELKELSSVVL